MIGRLRLWSGLVLFVYASLHLVNHVLGVVSIELLEQGRYIFDGMWRNPPGTVLLYGAFTVHVSLVLWSLFQRRRLRMSRAEWTQLVLGLSIVPLGAIHFVGTRFAHELFDTRTTYGFVLMSSLATGPIDVARQLGLVLVVWVHGCIGLHRAWRLKAWYAQARAWLLGAAVALPSLALAGSIAAMADYAAIMAQSAALQAAIAGLNLPDAAGVQHLHNIADSVRITGAVLVVLVFVARRVRNVWQRRAGVVTLAYAGLNGGLREVSMAVGPSVLEFSRHFGIPHASVCGGRGRCSTCRVRISATGSGEIPAAAPEEQQVLQRIDAPDGVRLACQLRLPTGQYRVTPLLPATASAADAYRPQGGALGRERLVAVLFCDLRGFTSLSEGRLPYDIVFILNRYFRAVGESVSAAGGRLDKFIGDGAMALFGPGLGGASDPPGPREAARQALDAARRIAEAVDQLNVSLSGDLERPLRLGIGLHAGPAIIGEMGWGPTVSLTAIGDTVNTASRLESASKELACELVVSAELLALAELPLEEWPEHLIEVRGRQGRLTVRAVKNAAQLTLAAT